MKVGNCLIFAILMRLALGGRIASRKSAYGWWRHYWWESPCGRVRAEFNPPRKRRRWLPPPIFRGAVTVWQDGNRADGVTEAIYTKLTPETGGTG